MIWDDNLRERISPAQNNVAAVLAHNSEARALQGYHAVPAGNAR
jgi:hypothetical protein